MNISMIASLLGGLGLFLYGMKVMGDGLEKTAGEKLQKIIQSLTGNIMKGVLVGTVVTGVIQSSSATTVMVVGFVNAGMMTLPQAVGVIMGANIGTTVTAQILRLGDIQSDVWYLQLVKTQNLAPIAVIVGIVMMLMMRKQKVKEIGEIVLGFGVLFMGMEMMSSSVQVLKDAPWLLSMFTSFKDTPILGVLTGTAVTAIIQSSSASVGILQAMASTGMITYGSAIPIVLGQNIGTCVTALLSSIGTAINAKRAAMIHLYFNIIGTIVFLIVIYVVQGFIGFPFWNDTVNRGNIADFHSIFNITNTLMLLPFAGSLVWLANVTVGYRKRKQEERKSNSLDERFLNAPNVAIAQCRDEIVKMGLLAMKNVRLAADAVVGRNKDAIAILEENENIIDEMEVSLNQYLVLITDKDLNESESRTVSEMFHAVTDIERMGDHAKNISEIYKDNLEKNVEFSDSARKELDLMFGAVSEIMENTIAAYRDKDIFLAKKVEPYEEVVDMFNDTLKNKHIERLKTQKCSILAGISFIEMIGNLERIADHCSNVALSVLKMNSDVSFDAHAYAREMHQSPDEEFNRYFREFEDKYYSKIEFH